MSDRQVTIRMPKELLAKWLAGLRDGEYKQGIGRLRDSKGGYCCLGVLEVVAGELENDGYAALPSTQWMERHQCTFLSQGGMPDTTPYLPSVDSTASEANDDSKFTFDQIATAIEDCAEGF